VGLWVLLALASISTHCRESLSHYFETVRAEQFDAYISFEETRAVTPFPAVSGKRLPSKVP